MYACSIAINSGVKWRALIPMEVKEKRKVKGGWRGRAKEKRKVKRGVKEGKKGQIKEGRKGVGE
jgi:hypothetical protein